MVEGQPHFDVVASQLLTFIGDDNVVGHNLPFDMKFLMCSGADLTKIKRRYFDTLRIARNTVDKAKESWDKDLEMYIESNYGVENYKLSTLCEYYGIPLVDAHRAENDALATGMLLHCLSNDRI